MPHVNFPASRSVAAGARVTAAAFVLTASAFAIADHAAPWTVHETVALRAGTAPIDDDLAAFYRLPEQALEGATPPEPCSG